MFRRSIADSFTIKGSVEATLKRFVIKRSDLFAINIAIAGG
jgi:hypothetical protein